MPIQSSPVCCHTRGAASSSPLNARSTRYRTSPERNSTLAMPAPSALRSRAYTSAWIAGNACRSTCWSSAYRIASRISDLPAPVPPRRQFRSGHNARIVCRGIRGCSSIYFDHRIADGRWRCAQLHAKLRIAQSMLESDEVRAARLDPSTPGTDPGDGVPTDCGVPRVVGPLNVGDRPCVTDLIPDVCADSEVDDLQRAQTRLEQCTCQGSGTGMRSSPFSLSMCAAMGTPPAFTISFAASAKPTDAAMSSFP